MDKKEVLIKLKKYSELIIKEFSVRKIILFGSYANGLHKINSDIDVAVIVDYLNEDILTSEYKLYKFRREIDSKIEPMLFEGENDASGFLTEILKNGEIIYSSV